MQTDIPSEIRNVIITEQLAQRVAIEPDYLREKLALQNLAEDMADHPTEVLPRLVQLAMEACGATSAGVSVLELKTRQFRWLALRGELAVFEGAHTPLDHSPCGVTLDENAAVLMQHPERVYGWISDAKIVVPEVLLVPLKLRRSDEVGAVGTLWVVAPHLKFFAAEHARVLTELAAFAAIALRMIQADEYTQKALAEQKELTQEMSHRVKNLFAITDSMIRLTERNSTTKDDFVQKFSGRLHALAGANALVRKSFGSGPASRVDLREALETVLGPYENTNVHGDDIPLGEQATNSVALIFHELATNAAKYGALSKHGSVDVSWTIAGDTLNLKWIETGGPSVSAPSQTGFGTALVESTVQRHNGTISTDWGANGLTVHIALALATLAR